MTRILICGAGPVGLWLAAELRLRAVDVVVLETRRERSPHSKALTIHPRTLELFAQRGIVEPFLDRGIPIPAGHFGALEERLDFRALDTPHPFTLLFPQAETEAILEERAHALGADIRRGHTLVGIDEGADAVTARVTGPDGPYAIEASYVAGCDGAGSVVRKASGIPFPGTDATLFGILADVRLDAPPRTPLYGFSNVTGQLMIVPLPSGEHRIVGVDPARQESPAGELGFDEFRASVVRITGDDFGMHSPRWVSRYGNASRVAERYSRGRVVLAGDAAHIHFPAGGVGMNVGLQDAHGLGWRLADVASGVAPAAVLDGYHAERHAVGLDLVRGTQAQTAVLAAFDADRQALRSLLGRLIADVPELSLVLSERLSGLDVAYPAAPGSHPLVGRRIPRVPAGAEAASRAGSALLLAPAAWGATVGAVLAETGVAFVVRESAEIVLVRPDGHIAWAADASAVAASDVTDALRRFRPAVVPA